MIGRTARALHKTPIFPRHLGHLTLAEINAGFVMLFIQALIGTQRVIAFLVLVFMALTNMGRFPIP